MPKKIGKKEFVEELLGQKAEVEELADIEEELSNEDEIQEVCEGGDSVSFYLQQAGKTKLLSREQEVFLAKKMADLKDPVAALEARSDFIKANLRLVISIAKRRVGRGVLFMDLIQAGNEAMIKSVDKFDPERECKFSSFAFDRIKNGIDRHISQKEKDVRLSAGSSDGVKRYQKFLRKYKASFGEYPDDETIKRELKLSCDCLFQIRQDAKFLKNLASMEDRIGDEGEDSSIRLDFTPDPRSLSFEFLDDDKELRKKLKSAFKKLDKFERRVIVLKKRFGFCYLSKIAKKFNVTPERVRRAEERGMRKLQSLLKRN